MSDAHSVAGSGGAPRAAVAALARRGAAALLVVCTGLWVAAVLAQGDAAAGDAERVARMVRGGCGYDTRSDPGREHVAAPEYDIEPPAGGDHLPHPAAAGVHETAPPDGELVHALEHGLVVVWLGADAPGPRSTEVRSLATRFSDDVLVVRRPGARGVAATAWHRRLACPSFDAAALHEFVCAFRGRGPERVTARRAAACGS